MKRAAVFLIVSGGVVITLSGCGGGGTAPPAAPETSRVAVHRAYGLGPIVHPKLTGTILGYDIDQHGTDGLLANYNDRSFYVSLETFDQTTGKITKVVKESKSGGYSVYGIFAHDIGFLQWKKTYELMEPVTGEKVSGSWTPPTDFGVVQIAENQSSSKQVMLGYDFGQPSAPTALVIADVARGEAKELALDQSVFGTGAVPVIAQDPATDTAVIAADDGGFDTHPTLGIIDLKSGKVSTFQGIGYGNVNGIGIDAKTDTLCTTTEDDAEVQFYNLKTLHGFEVEIPNSGGSQLHSGSGLAVDSIHGLCILGQPDASGTTESALWVVDEKGDFLEEFTGLEFWWDVGPVINPQKRIGYVLSPRPAYETLTGFSY